MSIWNEKQKEAIQTLGSNILVSAGAGSGKTTVLTARIIGLLEQGNHKGAQTDIDDFLICTFTKDAARNMKEKIKKSLFERGNIEQYEKVENSSISTFHNFCKRVIQENYDLINLPFKIRILENEELLINKALNEALNLLYEDQEFFDFAHKFSPNNDKNITEIMLNAYKALLNRPEGIEALKHQIEDPNFIDNAKGAFFSTLNFEPYYREVKSALGYFDQGSINHKKAKDMVEQIHEEYNMVKMVESQITKGEFSKGFDYIHFKTLITGMGKEPLLFEYVDARNAIKKTFKELDAYVEFANDQELNSQLISNLNILYKALSVFHNIYQDNKREKSFMTFNDLEHYTYDLVQHPNVQENLRNRYKYIFIDEYQDTSKIQQRIIDNIKREDNLFLVGDIKQSIYSFRNADPSMFYQTYQSYDYQGENIKIDLNENYRSNENILNFVNDIFSVLLNVKQEYYPKNAYLKTTTKFEPADVEIKIAIENKVSVEEITGNKIIELHNQGVAYKDMAVLFRKAKGGNMLGLYKHLRSLNIPCYYGVGSDDEMYEEIEIFLNLLSIIDNKQDDIALISVMLSDLFGFSPKDFAQVKINAKNSKTFYQSLISYCESQQDDQPLKLKIQEFFGLINSFNEKSKILPAHQLITVVGITLDFIKYLEGTPDSDSKILQYYRILQIAKEYQERGDFGLLYFLNSYRALKKRGKNFEILGAVSGSDVVRLMTIHKSKGLEFKAVILPDLHCEIGGSNKSGDLFISKDLGIGFKHIDEKFNTKCHNALTLAIEKNNKIDNFQEQMRLLYVACTRAMDHLIIVGKAKDFDKLFEKKEIPITNTKASLLSFITLAYQLRCHALSAKVTVEELSSITPIKLSQPKISTQNNLDVGALLNRKFDFKKKPSAQKISATALNQLLSKDVQITKNNEPLEPNLDKLKTGALFGSVMHKCLYLLDVNSNVEDFMEKIKREGHFNDEEFALIDKGILESFLQSPLSTLIKNANKVYKEREFVAHFSQGDSFEPMGNAIDNDMIVQGVIDCMIKTNEGYFIIDYKTDRLKDEEELKKRYRNQLLIYKKAIELSLEQSVESCYIYHLRTGKLIKV